MYIVAPGHAYISKGIRYKAGDEIDAHAFSSAKAFLKNIELGHIVPKPGAEKEEPEEKEASEKEPEEKESSGKSESVKAEVESKERKPETQRKPKVAGAQSAALAAQGQDKDETKAAAEKAKQTDSNSAFDEKAKQGDSISASAESFKE
jgi:hypothetical protein